MRNTFKESLKSGGTLVVTLFEWHIEYYIPGKDRRYKGTWVTVPGSCINFYINAWKDNFKKYISLKEKLADTTNEYLYCQGKCNMTIRVESPALYYPDSVYDGVCFGRIRVNTEEELNTVISDYEYAKSKVSNFRSRLLLLKLGLM